MRMSLMCLMRSGIHRARWIELNWMEERIERGDVWWKFCW